MLTVPVEERIAIEELTRLYGLYCDTRHFEKLAQLFMSECVYDESVVGGTPVSSRADLLELFRRASDRLGPMIHICTNQIISAFSGRAASGLCHVLAEGLFNAGGEQKPFRIFGCYDDRYSKEGDRWYFKSRVLKLLVPSQGAPTLGGITYDAVAAHLSIRPQAGDHEQC